MLSELLLAPPPLHGAESLKANSHSPGQEIPSLVWNPKVHNHFHKHPPLKPIMRQMTPFYALPTYSSSHSMTSVFEIETASLLLGPVVRNKLPIISFKTRSWRLWSFPIHMQDPALLCLYLQWNI